MLNPFRRSQLPSPEFKKELDRIDEDFRRFVRERIRQARTERHFTQEQLGRAIHKSAVIISDLERGRTELNVLDLVSIAAVLEKPVKYFFPLSNVPSEEELTTQEWELVLQFRKLERNPDLRELLLDEAKKLGELAEVKDARMVVKWIEGKLDESVKSVNDKPIERKQLQAMLKKAKSRMARK